MAFETPHQNGMKLAYGNETSKLPSLSPREAAHGYEVSSPLDIETANGPFEKNRKPPELFGPGIFSRAHSR
jgi:hypothetical protein